MSLGTRGDPAGLTLSGGGGVVVAVSGLRFNLRHQTKRVTRESA